MKIKSLLSENKIFFNFFAFIYSLPVFLKNLKLIFDGKLLVTGVCLKDVHFLIKGNNAKVSIAQGSVVKKCRFYCNGDNTNIIIDGGKTRIRNATFFCEDPGNRILIGRDFSMEGGHIASTEGADILIGDDCMFSDDVEIRNGDSHSIWSRENDKRINVARNVSIGNHTWLCAHSRIMKGSSIPDNCIVGNSSIVSGKLYEQNSVYVGIPAKLVKIDVDWSRNRFEK